MGSLAVGKTSKPLKIGVHIEMWDWPEIVKLRDQGHDVKLLDLDRFDRVFGRNCWKMNEGLKKYLDMSLKDARKEKYPPKVKADAKG